MEAVQPRPQTTCIPPIPHKYVVYNPKQDLQSNLNWRFVWLTAEVVTSLALLALAIPFFKTFHPLVALVTVLGLEIFSFVKFVIPLQNKVDSYAESAKLAQKILDKTKAYKDADLTKRFLDIGLSQDHVKALIQLYPDGAKVLLARYEVIQNSILPIHAHPQLGLEEKRAKIACLRAELALIFKIMTSPYQRDERILMPSETSLYTTYKCPTGKEYRIEDFLNTPIPELAENVFA